MDDSRSQFEKPLFTPSVSFNRELKRRLDGNRTRVQEPSRHNATSHRVKPLSHNEHKRPSSEALLQIISQLASTNSDRNQSSKLSNKSVAPSFNVNRGGLPLLIKVLNKIPPSLLSSKSHTIVSVKEPPFNNYTGCKSDGEYRCKNGECVAQSLHCNQLVDCSDGSDEKNCTCADYLRGQLLSRKICDGVVDCWDFSDETNCDWCLSGQHVCANSRLCVNQSQICDGRKDCPFGDDEKQCINVAPSLKQANDFIYHATGHLMVRKQGVWGKLCLQNPAASHSKLHYKIKTLGQTACKSLSFRELDFVEPDQDLSGETQNSSSVYYDLISSNWTTISNTSFQRTTCPHRQVIKIKCKDLQCGVRPQASGHTGNSLRYSGASKRHSRIVGGGNAGLGSWPWQAALYKEGEFQCGAALINAKWLLSAGHCFYNAQEDYWVARLGALRRGVNFASPYEQVRTISRIMLHPEYQAISFMNDISLLELNEPVQTSHYIRPICLPPPASTLEDGTMCTVVGWGQLFEIDRVFPDTLQEVQLPVISAAECRKRTLFLPLYRVTDNMFCAGYERGGRDACLGDSGGPLMCQETDGRWSLYGVTSNGYGCARANRPGVYTKVVNYIGWIQNSMAISNNELPAPETRQCAGHRCRLGECLPQQRVCNGYVECSDGSDEKDCWQD
ncbi:unnamed protein product [Bemisia tabaci]|nr:unnamed protein product [Bemisia tabaci]